MKRLLLIFISALVLAVPSLGLADPDGGFFGHKGDGHRKGEREMLTSWVNFKSCFYLQHAKDLGLTKEQIDKIRATSLEFNKKRVRDIAEAKATMMDLVFELHQDNPDQGKLNSFIDKKSDIKKGLDKAAIQAVLDIRNTLTPEQKEKVKSLWMEKKGFFRGFGHGNKECKACPVAGK